MNNKGEKGKGRYNKLREHAELVLDSMDSALPSIEVDESKSQAPFSAAEIAKFTGMPSSEALALKESFKKYPSKAQELSQQHATWKAEQNEKITAFSDRMTNNFQAELERLLRSHGLKERTELRKNKASIEVNARYLELERIIKRIPERTKKNLENRMASYKNYKDEMAIFLGKQASEAEALDKYHNDYCTKYLIKVANVVWGLAVLPGFFKKCATGSYFFSSTGKTKEVVEAAFDEAVTDKTKRCCC